MGFQLSNGSNQLSEILDSPQLLTHIITQTITFFTRFSTFDAKRIFIKETLFKFSSLLENKKAERSALFSAEFSCADCSFKVDKVSDAVSTPKLSSYTLAKNT